MANPLNFTRELGPFDILPLVRFYSVVLLAFPLYEQNSRLRVTEKFKEATTTLFGYYPWLSGQVERDKEWKGEHEASRPFKIVPNQVEGFQNVQTNDVTGILPTYRELQDARFPMGMLDGRVLSPFKGIPDLYTDEDHTPVFVVRLNYVNHGVLACFSVMHSAMDGNALGHLIRQFATLMRGESLSEADIEAGDLNANQVLPSLPQDKKPLKIHDRLYKDPNAKEDAGPDPGVPCSWAYFDISPDKMSRLKDLAGRDCPLGAWITSDDALTALLWRAIVRSRAHKLDMSLSSTLARAINLRRRLDPSLPLSFLANCVTTTFSDARLSELVNDMSLSRVANLLRQAMNTADDHFARSYITFLRSLADKGSITFAGKNPDRDCLVSSWCSWPVYGSDFGDLLGKPECVRRPRMAGMDGLVYLMPKSEDGRVAVAIGLNEDTMEKLKLDEELLTYTEYLG